MALTYKEKLLSKRLNLRACLAEFVGMAFFVFTACGIASLVGAAPYAQPSAPLSGDISLSDAKVADLFGALVPQLQSNGGLRVIAALGFGVSILVLAYALGHISGCHLNPSVSLALWLSAHEEAPGKVHCGVVQLAANIACQCAGSILGAALLLGSTPNGLNSTLGSNLIDPSVTNLEALLGEGVMTCLLCLTVLLCVADKTNQLAPMAPVAIGMAVFLGNALLIPIDGASINFARSLGPAVVSGKWSTEQYGSTKRVPIIGPGRFWVFFVGPIAGGLVAVPIWYALTCKPWGDSHKEKPGEAPANILTSNDLGDADAKSV